MTRLTTSNFSSKVTVAQKPPARVPAPDPQARLAPLPCQRKGGKGAKRRPLTWHAPVQTPRCIARMRMSCKNEESRVPTQRQFNLQLLAPALVAVLALAGCKNAGDDPYYGNVAYLSRQDVVPLTRPLPLVEMQAPMVVDFELPRHGQSASPRLSMGIRIGYADTLEASREMSPWVDCMLSGDLAARVSLQRLEHDAQIEVPLTREQRLPAGETTRSLLAGGNQTSLLWLDDVDPIAMQVAGLLTSGHRYEQLAFAQVQDPAPGMYRLSLQLQQLPDCHGPAAAQLFISYGYRPK